MKNVEHKTEQECKIRQDNRVEITKLGTKSSEIKKLRAKWQDIDQWTMDNI